MDKALSELRERQAKEFRPGEATEIESAEIQRSRHGWYRYFWGMLFGVCLGYDVGYYTQTRVILKDMRSVWEQRDQAFKTSEQAISTSQKAIEASKHWCLIAQMYQHASAADCNWGAKK